MSFIYEIRAMKEWGLVRNYGDYFDLPEPVVLAWRECARAESAATAPASKPTQDLLAQERASEEAI